MSPLGQAHVTQSPQQPQGATLMFGAQKPPRTPALASSSLLSSVQIGCSGLVGGGAEKEGPRIRVLYSPLACQLLFAGRVVWLQSLKSLLSMAFVVTFPEILASPLPPTHTHPPPSGSIPGWAPSPIGGHFTKCQGCLHGQDWKYSLWERGQGQCRPAVPWSVCWLNGATVPRKKFTSSQNLRM